MEKGTLILVATPIGNMGDITKRAVEALGSVDLVASEDTRTTGMLLKRLGIVKPQMSFHSFNEEASAQRIVAELSSGKTVALVSDAGTPGISDPGYSIVRLAADEGFEVTMAPGPTALIMALVLSALPTSSFTFRGFPPRSSSKRRRFFADDADSEHTLVYYESPHRLADSIGDAYLAFGDRRAALCNDLTKKFEKVERGTLGGFSKSLEGKKQLLGEYVIVIAGIEKAPSTRVRKNKYRPEGDEDGEWPKRL